MKQQIHNGVVRLRHLLNYHTLAAKLWSQTELRWLSPLAFGSVLGQLNKDYRDIVLQCAAAQPHTSDQTIDGVVHR